jgi:hypothetical protein
MAHQQVTLATLQTRLLERVDSSRFWVAAEATIKLNDALKFWNILTGRWRRSVSRTLTAASDPYNIFSSTMTWPMRMEVASTGRLIEKTSIAALDNAIPGWENQTLTSGGTVPTQLTFWAPRSFQFFAVWPRIPVGGASVTVDFDGVSETPVLVNAGDFLDLEDNVHDVILGYAAHLLLFKKGGPKFFQTTAAYDDLIVLAGDYNQQLRATSLYRQAAMRVTDRDHKRRRRPETENRTLQVDLQGRRAPRSTTQIFEGNR